MDGWMERERERLAFSVPACAVELSATMETLCIHTVSCSRASHVCLWST